MNVVKRTLYIIGRPGMGMNFFMKALEGLVYGRHPYHADKLNGADWIINTGENIRFEVELKEHGASSLKTLSRIPFSDDIILYITEAFDKEFWNISNEDEEALQNLAKRNTVIIIYPNYSNFVIEKALDILRDRLSLIEYFIPLASIQTNTNDDYFYRCQFITLVRQIIINSHPDSLWLANKIIRENLETRSPRLDLGNCGLTTLKNLTQLFKCTHLKELILSNEWGEYNGNELKRKTSENNFEHNIFFTLPREIENLRKLEILIAGGNWSDTHHRHGTISFTRWYIHDIRVLSHLPSIHTLNLSNNGIQNFEPLAGLNRLRQLYLNNNQISSFPSIQYFPKLAFLFLSNNKIENVSFLAGPSGLKLIDLHSNQISDLTPIKWLINRIDIVDSQWEANTISIGNNPLSIPPLEVVSKGKDNVMAYFNQLEAEREIELSPYLNADIKLIVVGNSNVGKSTFIYWLENNKVDKEISTTHWLKFGVWRTNRNGKEYTIRIFDFGGQEYYHETHHLFFTNRTAYALLWDQLTNDFGEVTIKQRQKDNKIKEVTIETFPLEYWLDSIRYHTQKRNTVHSAKTIEKIFDERNMQIEESIRYKTLLGTDSAAALQMSDNYPFDDQFEEEENILILQNKVDTIRDKSFINEQNLKANYPKVYDFEQISLYSEKRLDLAKETLFDIFDSLEILNRQYLGTWNYIKQAIEKCDFADSWTIEGFLSYCNSVIRNLPQFEGRTKKQQNKVLFSMRDAKVFASFLSDIGLCLYYPENDELKDKVFLNQKKIMNDLNDVLLEIAKNNGEISKNAIAKTLGGSISDKEVTEVIDLMLHFKILFRHPIASKRSYIAPLYLPAEPPKSIKLFQELFEKPVYRFKYKTFIHKSIILNFFHEYGAQTLSETSDDGSFYYWKNGIVIKSDSCNDIVMVKFVPWNSKDECALLDVFAINGTSDEFVKEIVDYVDSINKGIKVIKLVPNDAGNELIPLEIIHENEKNVNAIFHFENKYYKLTSFRKYLKSPLKMKKIFISYSKQDLALVNKFIEHLSALQRDGKVSHWYCSALEAGSVWNDEIQKHFDESDIACFMISPNFMKTEYIHEYEIKNAIERKKVDKDFKIVPIILNFCRWTTTNNNLGDYTALPYTAKPIMDFNNQDMGWYITEACLRIMIDNDLDPKGDDFYKKQALPSDVLRIYERIVSGKVDNNSY